jgi:protein phosphatase 1 regulatory subunit 7
MSLPIDNVDAQTAAMSLDDNAAPSSHEVESSSGPRNSKGWDGKLRMPKTATLANPEALSDPEYSDDENILDGEEIEPDEGQ